MVGHILPRRPWLWMAVGWALISAAMPASAATFTVGSRVDDFDATPGDGICATLQGLCTLRAAIQEANALGGTDTINLPHGVYALKAGELAVTADLFLLGEGPPGTTIKNIGQARVMSIASGSTVGIFGVRLQRGQAEIGAGLLNEGTVTLNNVAFAGNRAASAAFGLGGGIHNSGTVTLSNSTFAGNRATGTSGGGFGGGIYNTGTLHAADVAFTGNFTDGCGGAVYNVGGSVDLMRTSLMGNHVSNSGGGIFNQAGSIELSATTLARNRAKQLGGGIFTYAPVTLTNVTMTANRAATGGAILSGGNSTLTLANVTANGNRATQGAGIFNNNGSVTLYNTVVALNLPNNCEGSPAVVSLGHNLDSANTCSLAAAGDLTNSNPRLGVLRNNGGATKTCALLPGSPAIDAGDNTDCPGTDQCGNPRPAGVPAVCDIGAYEVQP